MPTFKAVVLGSKKNGERQIYIRITHNRRHKNVKTGMTALSSDVHGGELTNGMLIDKVNEAMKEMRERCNSVGASLATMSIEQIVSIATTDNSFDDDFTSYFEKFIDRMKKDGRHSTAKNYTSALKSLRRYGGDRITFSQMTTDYVLAYKEYLRSTSRRTSYSYIMLTACVYRSALKEYNGDALEDKLIKRNPFEIVKPDSNYIPRKRALSVDEILRIRDCEATGMMLLARDVFMLSFYLVGMNLADLYELKPMQDGKITYERKKTRTRRKDKAKMVLAVPPEAIPMFDAYKSKDEGFALSLHETFLSSDNMTGSLSYHLSRIGKKVGISGLTFYAARHSWATIALNDCGIDIYTIEKALCHAPSGLAITEVYITQDFSKVDNANRLVLDRLAEEEL